MKRGRRGAERRRDEKGKRDGEEDRTRKGGEKNTKGVEDNGEVMRREVG